jgi:hypothetical protein
MLQNPAVVTFAKVIEPRFDTRPLTPALYGGGAKLEEDPLPAVLDGGEPARLLGQRGALDVGLVIPIDIRRDGLETCEASQGEHLAQPVELEDALNPLAALRVPPDPVGQAAHVKVGIDGNVLAEPFDSREQRLQLDLLHRPVPQVSTLQSADRGQHLVVTERFQLVHDPRLPLQDRELGGIFHDLQIIPQLGDHHLHRRAPVRKREHAHHLGK